MGAKQSVKTRDFRKVIAHWGLVLKGTRGSHERWSKPGMLRPVIFQSKEKEIPEFIFRNNLKAIGKTTDDFFETLKSIG